MAKTTARNATTRPNNFPPTFQGREIYCVEPATAVAGRNILGFPGNHTKVIQRGVEPGVTLGVNIAK